MAKRPKNRRVDIPATDLAPSPIMMTAKAIENRRGRKQDEKYQDALREMGMFDNAGGRGREEFRGRAQRMKRGKVTKMEQGGKVPSKYKGFSKLRENVQRQMDSGLAEKYEYGGKVGGCRGGGAAVSGTKFTGCK